MVVESVIGHARAIELLLNRENPRHEPKRNQAEIIEYLLKDEQVYNLARHISANGLNPLEIVAVFADDEGNLVVAEGNRRVCALQLLLDPGKAPAEQRARFVALAKNGHFPEQILVAQFHEYEQARPWLKIIHDGEQDGVGRRRWRTEQKARFTEKASTSILAVKLLDYAIAAGLIAKEEKDSISVTTMTRYLENPAVRGALGIATTATNPDVRVELPHERFGPVVSRFIEDARTGVLSSRSRSPEWRTYARDIEREFNTRQSRINQRPLDAAPTQIPTAPQRSAGKKASLRTVTPDRIMRSESIVIALNDLASAKLSSIYKSLTSLSLTDHPALMTAGAWIFLESLTALHGRSAGISFDSYINSLANNWLLGKEEKKEIRLSVAYIADNGNAEKHSKRFTTLDARNLRSHFDVLENMIVHIIEGINL